MDYLSQITDYLLRQSWQIAILVVVIAAVTLALRNKSSHVRYLLWLIVLAKCLVPPLLTVPLAVLPQAGLPEPTVELSFREPAIDFEEDNAPVAKAPLSLPSPVIAAPQPITADTAPKLTARQRLGLGWIAGVTVFVLVAVTKALRTEFWLRRERKHLPVELKSEIENLFSCFGIRTLSQVWLVEGIGQPFVWGVLRGSIYLPGNFVKVNNSENRRGVLGHELCHVMRFDTVINLLQVVSQAIFWFHPLVWWANKRLRAEREKCCDEMAIACLSAKAKDYSTAIVNILITEHKSTRPVPSLAVAGPVKNIEERIKTMTRPGKKFYKRPSLRAAMAVLLLALLSVPATFVLTARAQRAEPAALPAAENEPDALTTDVPYSNSEAGAAKYIIPEANLQIPDDLKPCAEVLRKIYAALKKYEKDKGSMPDWLSDLVPDYLSAEMLIWPEDGPRTTPLAPEPHLPCSFGYQYSSLARIPGGGASYRQFKDQERLIWGDVVPLVRYYRDKDKKCLNLSFDGRVYFSGSAWETEIPTLSGKVLTNLEVTTIPVLPARLTSPTEPRRPLEAAPGTVPKANRQIPDELKPCAQRLRRIYYALKLYEKDKGSMPDWLSDIVPEYISAEMLIWPEDGPKSSPLATEPHLPCSFGYQYSGLAQIPGGGASYRQFKDQERLIWGDIVPLVRYYRDKDKKCVNLSFDGRIYFSGSTWEKEIPTLSGQILTELETTAIPVSPALVPTPTEPRPWGPEQATGEPDTHGAGDFYAAWAPLEADAGPEWLKVDFERAVKIAALRIRESFNPGAVSKISAIVEDGRERVLWEGRYPTSEVSNDMDFILRVVPTVDVPLYVKGYSGFSILLDIGLQEDVISKSIKIYLDTSRIRGWNEIDAVQLIGKDGSKRWACRATASSTRATGVTRIIVSRGGESRPAAPTKIQPSEVKGEVLVFDDFDGKLGLKWEVLNPDMSHYSLSKRPGTLTITTQDGHFKEANADYKNVFLIDTPMPPDQDFQITTCLLAFQPLKPYNQAGLICWDDDDNYLEWVYQMMNRRGLNFNAGVEANGPTRYTYIPSDRSFEKLWLRVTKRGSSYQCSSSTDGESFTVHTVEHWGDGSPKQVGLFASNGSSTHPPEVDASFDFFEVISIAASPIETEVVPSDGPQYETDLEAFIQEMDRAYPFFELKGIRDEWEKTKKQLQQKVQSCKSDEQFLEIVTEAILCLRDSHMWFRNAKAQVPQRPTKYYPGISFMPATNEQVVVMSCREGLDRDLKIGTIVSRIDGKNARRYLEEQAEARWAEGGISGPQRARLFAYRIPLCGEKKGEKHTITILADGKQRQVELSSDIEARGWPHWYNRPRDLKQVGSCSYTILPSGIGYIYLRRIDGSTGSGMKEAFSTYSEAKGWIVDLRGNGGGGYDQTLHEVLRALPGPMAVIIDAGCMSAGETMARDLARQGKARLFGSKTAGASSAKRIWTFPSGVASLSVPTRSRWGINGKPIEFLGIEPHVKVEAVPEELKRGLNSAILRAEEYIIEITSAETQ